MRNIIAFSLAITLPALAHGIEDKELMACAAESNSVKRLDCFDMLSSKHGLAPSTKGTTPDGSGKWSTSTDIDPLTDKSVHYAILESDSGRSRFGKPVSLVVRCQNNKTEMYINWQSFLGSDRIGTTFRVDKASAQTSNWSLSTDKKAAFFPGSPITILRQISDSESFVANVTPYSASPITAVFDTSGADKALADIRKGCSW